MASKPSRSQRHRKTLHTPVFQLHISRSSSSKLSKSSSKKKTVIPKAHAEAVISYVERLSQQHIALAQMFQEVPCSRPGSPVSDEEEEDEETRMSAEFVSSKTKAAVEDIRGRVLEAYEEARGDTADPRWTFVSRLLRPTCTRSRHWLPRPPNEREARDPPPDTSSWADELASRIRQTWMPNDELYDRKEARKKEEKLQKMVRDWMSDDADREPAVIREIIEKRTWAQELTEFTRSWVAETTTEQSTEIRNIIAKDKLLKDVETLLTSWIPDFDKFTQVEIRDIIQRRKNVEDEPDFEEITEKVGKDDWVKGLKSFVKDWPESAQSPPKAPVPKLIRVAAPTTSTSSPKQKRMETVKKVREWVQGVHVDDMMDVDTPSDPPTTQTDEDSSQPAPKESVSKAKRLKEASTSRSTVSKHDSRDGNALGFTASKSSIARLPLAGKSKSRSDHKTSQDIGDEVRSRPSKVINEVPETFLPPSFGSQLAQSTPPQVFKRRPSPIPREPDSSFPSNLSEIPVPLDTSSLRNSKIYGRNANNLSSDVVPPVPSSSLEHSGHSGPSSPLHGKTKAKSSPNEASKKRSRSPENDNGASEQTRPAKVAKVQDNSSTPPADISMAAPSTPRPSRSDGPRVPSSSPLTSLAESPTRPRPNIFPTAAELNAYIPKTPNGKKPPTLTEILSSSIGKGKKKSTFGPKGVAKKINTPPFANGSGSVASGADGQSDLRRIVEKSKSDSRSLKPTSKDRSMFMGPANLIVTAVPHIPSKTSSTEALSGFRDDADQEGIAGPSRVPEKQPKPLSKSDTSNPGLRKPESQKPQSQKSLGVKPLSKATTSFIAGPEKPESQTSKRSLHLAPVAEPGISDESGMTISVSTKDSERDPQSIPSTKLGTRQDTYSTAQPHQPEPSFEEEIDIDIDGVGMRVGLGTTKDDLNGVDVNVDVEEQDPFSLSIPASVAKPVSKSKPPSKSSRPPRMGYIGMDDDLDAEMGSPTKSLSSLAGSDSESDDDDDVDLVPEGADDSVLRAIELDKAKPMDELDNPLEFTLDGNAFVPFGTSTQPRNDNGEDDANALFGKDGRINVRSLDVPLSSPANQMLLLSGMTPPGSIKKNKHRMDGKRDARGLRRAGTTDSGSGYGLGGSFQFGYNSQMDVDSRVRRVSQFIEKDVSLAIDEDEDEDEDDWKY